MELAPPRVAETTESTPYRGHPVRLETFEGPLDLLLEIIKQNREEIWEISISRITRQYLEYLETWRALNIEVAGEFLVMAASLMRIKSQMLLPRPSFVQEDDEEAPLTREGLITKLLEYRRFKEVALRLRQKEDDQGQRFVRGAPASLEAGYQLPLREPRLIDLVTYFQDVVNKQKEVVRHEVQLEEIALEDQMDWIRSSLGGSVELERLPNGEGDALRFSRLLRRENSTLEVVVTFLAVLELAKLQGVSVRQFQTFAEIWLMHCTPRREDPLEDELKEEEASHDGA
ncbi:MAG: segregation/condensation protein A [Candidatus Eisenbacteria bacterium]|uniref:Segregation and condensation protein A n=1 Tax=Eiseniibacteriota bacterium TaxID=2212470 RepID=A0A956M1A9_UNCEI|nr:segregation/condensation protein A [Candidatus Eisenbacteria bacterium]